MSWLVAMLVYSRLPVIWRSAFDDAHSNGDGNRALPTDPEKREAVVVCARVCTLEVNHDSRLLARLSRELDSVLEFYEPVSVWDRSWAAEAYGHTGWQKAKTTSTREEQSYIPKED